ncbi:MAG TPA: DUF4062 domain-containing protein [Nitrososphaeraceae archaeon]|nr:DUF4062 domain-containing protein [Nitrososphaeraceae archaeon]
MAKDLYLLYLEDLKEYREAVSHALRKVKAEVIAMENYVAQDQRPLQKCLEDVASSDIYIGIFALKYGYIPKEDNPDCLSITELEYHKAKENGIPTLIFLLEEKVVGHHNILMAQHFLKQKMQKKFLNYVMN